jgi:hypothetical protein
MNQNDDAIKENILLREELEKIRIELTETKEHLKKYTAPARSKTYYENHREEVIQKVKNYNH